MILESLISVGVSVIVFSVLLFLLYMPFIIMRVAESITGKYKEQLQTFFIKIEDARSLNIISRMLLFPFVFLLCVFCWWY